MADFVLDAAQVGEVIAYVAPGFLAQLGYRTRYPAPERSTGQVVVVSVVLSLPLVALANAAISGSHKPTQVVYVLALTGGSFIVGYVAAIARGWRGVKALLGRFGHLLAPEGSIYAQTLKHMSKAAPVLIEFKDGRRVSGTPCIGPESKDDGINELYLTHPTAEGEDGQWHDVGAGLIVPLSELSSIVLSEDPTGSSTA